MTIKQIREEMGHSFGDYLELLKLSPAQLRVIENNDYSEKQAVSSLIGMCKNAGIAVDEIIPDRLISRKKAFSLGVIDEKTIIKFKEMVSATGKTYNDLLLYLLENCGVKPFTVELICEKKGYTVEDIADELELDITAIEMIQQAGTKNEALAHIIRSRSKAIGRDTEFLIEGVFSK